MKESKYENKDIISQTIGACGKWQIRTSILIGFLKFSLAWTQFAIIFFAPPQKFWCKHSETQLNSTNNSSRENECFVQVGNDSSGNEDNESCTEFVYDNSVFKSTIISEWNLVCSRAFLVEITQMSFMGGFLIGCVLFGLLSDKYGRKRPLMIAIVIQIVSGFCIAFSSAFMSFISARFISAMASGGLSVISFVLCTEVFGGKWRTIVPILYHAPLGIGNAMMAGLAYLLRDWRHLQLILCVITSFYIIYIWLLPESPRWLLATNQIEEAKELLEKAAIINGKNPDAVKDIICTKDMFHSKQSHASLKSLLKRRDFKIKTLILCVEWFGAGMCIFAFVQYVGMISRNIFLGTIILGLNVLPGLPLCVLVAHYFNRKKIMITSQFIALFCFIFILMIPKGVYILDWPRLLLSGIGIISIDVFVPLLYVYTGEIYPTKFRNVAIGCLTLISRIGSILAPLILSLEKVSTKLPLAVLAGLLMIMAACLFPLPETRNNLSEIPSEDNTKNLIHYNQREYSEDLKLDK